MMSALLAVVLLVAQMPMTFRTEVALVRVDAEVTVDGLPVEQLQKEDFRITDNGKPCEIVYFGFQEEPLDLVLLLDTSYSMRPVVERISHQATSALRELRPGDRIAVMAF